MGRKSESTHPPYHCSSCSVLARVGRRDSDRTHCMTCRTSITTPPSRAVVSLTPSLRTMITTPSNSTIDTLTVNVQLVSTQLRWTPFTGKVNTTKKEQPHHFVVLTPPTAVIKEPHLPRLLPALSKLMRSSIKLGECNSTADYCSNAPSLNPHN